MRVPYNEGPAIHIGPESCVGGREGAGKTLTGVSAGRVLSRESRFASINTPEISQEAYFALTHYTWPGNIAELQNRIKKAILVASGAKIMPADLGLLKIDFKKRKKERTLRTKRKG